MPSVILGRETSGPWVVRKTVSAPLVCWYAVRDAKKWYGIVPKIAIHFCGNTQSQYQSNKKKIQS